MPLDRFELAKQGYIKLVQLDPASPRDSPYQHGRRTRTDRHGKSFGGPNSGFGGRTC
jgi:hypothetical protein